MENVVGKIPEFTPDTPAVNTGKEEVKQEPGEKPVIQGEGTPPEPPAGEKPLEEGQQEPPKVDTGELIKQVEGLQNEKNELLRQIQDLRGTRREIKQEQLQQVEQKLDELKDLHPDDVAVIDKILRAKGYITKEEANKMFYKGVQDEELTKFLNKYPEYKPENDPNNTNWNALERELGFYRLPNDPHQIGEILERAHRGIQRTPSGGGTEVKQRKINVAGAGGTSGGQPSSSKKTLEPRFRDELERGGWSEEDIKKIESKL